MLLRYGRFRRSRDAAGNSAHPHATEATHVGHAAAKAAHMGHAHAAAEAPKAVEPRPGHSKTVADEAIADEAIVDEPIADEPIADEAVGDEAIGDEAVGDEWRGKCGGKRERNRGAAVVGRACVWVVVAAVGVIGAVRISSNMAN